MDDVAPAAFLTFTHFVQLASKRSFCAPAVILSEQGKMTLVFTTTHSKESHWEKARAFYNRQQRALSQLFGEAVG
jgi:hypothetical protein